MPNTKPNTHTADALADKLKRAAGRMWCEHAFYVGAPNANARYMAELELLPGAAGIKVFMGASTGHLIVSSDDVLAAVLARGRPPAAIHPQDAARTTGTSAGRE